ncbi:MAG: diacylglycerol/lipid kinase family protein, partial [Desulfobulbales bacterium]
TRSFIHTFRAPIGSSEPGGRSADRQCGALRRGNGPGMPGTAESRSRFREAKAMSICFIYNPGSGSGNRQGKKAKRLIKCWLASQPSDGHTLKITRDLPDAERLALEAHAVGFEKIVAVGGDGTVNRVINSFFDANGSPRSPACMGVLYTGTSPDFCKSYNISLDLQQALAGITQTSSVRSIPVAEINLRPKYNADATCTRRFACCANIGIGPELARRANSGMRHRWGDFWGTFLSLLALLRTYRPRDFEIVQDGQRYRLECTTNIFLGLTRHVASGLMVAHDLERHPGSLYRVAVTNMRLRDIPKGFLLLYGGRPLGNSPPFALKRYMCSTKMDRQKWNSTATLPDFFPAGCE